MKKIFSFLLFLFFADNVFAQLRTFNDIFPNLNQDIRILAFKESGYVKSSQKTSGFIIIGNAQTSRLDPQIVNNVLQKNPGFFVESILVLEGTSGSVSLLNIYNALGNIGALKGRLYSSFTKKKSVPLFEEANRIVSEKQTTAIPDPPPAKMLPAKETVYIRLKDVNFGNTYYRAEMALIQNGLRYTLTNFRNMSYLFIPVIKEEKFIAQLYFEPIQEGVLIYSVAGTDISDFIASKIDIDSAISKRLNVINSWAIDGIRKKK
ncbi:hypothetical protein R84B8_02098 [Treponema sp. R8-4-B8]